eukprot:CAMPEP_0201999202 /NCGR_PEP_ID=MMETSP0905-20130828/5836_1 /ASSEMBLY_ACC=CAM_ASM_000554 /TAXON_ID=420261 /ORGANISM="Thalassiosira antarctica, Strain CCMP982" /LENGTH=40 /DNA_ID= /DNA_START= /DNA_END= /DNA_ORIENTATION=
MWDAPTAPVQEESALDMGHTKLTKSAVMKDDQTCSQRRSL